MQGGIVGEIVEAMVGGDVGGNVRIQQKTGGNHQVDVVLAGKMGGILVDVWRCEQCTNTT